MARRKRIPEDVYRAVFDRAASDAGYPVCEAMIKNVCKGGASEFHHRKMRSQGGGHYVSNALAVCPACHRFFHNHPKIAYEKGWLVKGSHDHQSSIVFRRGEVVKLEEDGKYTKEPETINGRY